MKEKSEDPKKKEDSDSDIESKELKKPAIPERPWIDLEEPHPSILSHQEQLLYKALMIKFSDGNILPEDEQDFDALQQVNIFVHSVYAFS